MGTFFVYILKSSFCLIVFYLFYRLLLSKETFHRFNRIALLGSFLLSLFIPFCEISTKEPQPIIDWQKLMLLADSGQMTVTPEVPSIQWPEIILLVYIAGLFFFFCRNIYSLFKITKLLRNSKRESLENGVILITHQKNMAPFSWMKFVVISETDLEEDGREILIHELAHIRNRHSIDLLIAEFCILFHWFNPASWLMKQELQNIHEYEADETVINQGIDAKKYQLLLIKKAVGTRLYSMANSFNHSKLKKRITMMLKEKSSPWARLKYLYVLPVAALAVTAFARPEISKKLNEISAVKISDLSSIVEGNQENNVLGKEASSIDKEEESDKLNLVASNDSSKIKTVGKGQPLVMIDGEAIPFEELSKITSEAIESIDILKDKSSEELYGEKGKNGTILITTKEKIRKDVEEGLHQAEVAIAQAKEAIKNIKIDTAMISRQMAEAEKQILYAKAHSGEIKKRVEEAKKAVAEAHLSDNYIFSKANDGIVFILDGKKVSTKELNDLDKAKISSVNVLKGDHTKTYGKNAKNGVIIITTDKAK